MNFLSFNFIDLLVYACIAISSYILYIRLKNEKRMKQYEEIISKFPGPSPRFLGGNELDFLFKKNISFILLNYIKEYGPRFTLQLGGELHLVLADPKDVEEILGSTKYVEKGPTFIKSFGRIFGNGVFSCDANVWKKNRKIMQFPFRTNILDKYTDTMNEETSRLIQQFQKAAEAGETFNALKYVGVVPFNVFCRELLDTDTSSPVEEFNAFKESNGKHLDECTQRIFAPKVVTCVKDFLQKKQYSQIQHDLAFTYNKIRNEGRLKRDNDIFKTKDAKEFRKFIYYLRDGPFTEQDIKDDVITYTAGATETIGVTVSFFLLVMGMYQDIQNKVYEEVYSILGNTGDRDVTADEFNKMTYLDQVIKETQRLFPIVPLLFRYLTESATIGGHVVPPGINIIVHAYALQIDPNYFPEPGKFDPERFSSERRAQIPKGSFVPFSIGPRNCIGKAFAMHQMKIVCSRLIYNFHIKTDKKLDDITMSSSFVLGPSDGQFPISVSARKH